MRYILFTQHWSVLPPDFILQQPGNILLACDGACNRFQELNLRPDIILGDFDSVRDPNYWGITAENVSAYRGREGVLIVPTPNQDYTDLEKAIHYADAHQATELIIVTETIGRQDHTLYNLRLLRKYHRVERPMWLLTSLEMCEFVRDRRVVIEGPIGLSVSLMAFPAGSFTSQGLRYEGQDLALRFAEQDSICNELASTAATIEIQGDILVIYAINHD